MSVLKIIEYVIMIGILITVSYIDIKHRIIPNRLVIIILIIGGIFVSLGNISFYKAFLGMLFGGGLMLLLALVPNTLGGGDIKLMFALGAFLGPIKIIWAIVIAFVLAAMVSILLLFLKIIKKNEFIPFGPFLALGSIIAYVII